MPENDIVIVGGGPAGLSTAGALKAIGLEAVVLDQDDRIGGSWLRRYERLHLHTVRAFSGLAHFPIPRHFPKYISRDQYAAVFAGLRQAFQFEMYLEQPRAQGAGGRMMGTRTTWSLRRKAKPGAVASL